MTQPAHAFPMTPPPTQPRPASGSPCRSGARLVAADGTHLPLRGSALEAEAGGGLARTTVRQTFWNAGDEPLAVTYLLPLPADGAVSGFAFTLDGVTTRGVVEERQAARQRFEDALLDGHGAALLEEDRTSLFTQEIGNVPAGAEVIVEVTVDHPTAWVQHRGDGGWEYRFPTVVAPRYPGTGDAGGVDVAIAEGDVGPTASLTLDVLEAATAPPTSPSHQLAVSGATVSLAGVASLDRDVVVRWSVAAPEPAVRLEAAQAPGGHARAGMAYGLLTVVPPLAPTEAVPRDLIVLLDTSGSMTGAPLAQAVAVASALVESLGDHDQLELVEFSWKARRWRRRPAPATRANKASALSWLTKLEAGGGTEMQTGIRAALASLREGAQRQVVLVSDGLIGFEQAILRQLEEGLPPTCRVHTVGVGHGVNRSLMEPAARLGRGVEVTIAPEGAGHEDPSRGELVVARDKLLAATAMPLAVNLRVGGSALATGQPPPRLPDLFSGRPVTVPIALNPEGGDLELIGDGVGDAYRETLTVAAPAAIEGSRIFTRFARHAVAEYELAAALGEDVTDPVTRLGIDFQISTPHTSWVAVTEAPLVDPTAATRRVTQPHRLAAGLSAEGVGLRRGRGGPLTVAHATGAFPVPQSLAAPSAPLGGAPRGGFAPPPPAGAPPPPERRSERRRTAPTAQRPAPAAPGAKAPGLLGRLGEAFGGLFGPGGGDEDETVRDEEVLADAPDEGGRGGRPVVEREGVPRVTGLRLVVTLPVDAELAELIADERWSLPVTVQVALDDGSVVEARVDVSRSTRLDGVVAGQELRLVVELLSAPPSAPVGLSFEALGWRLVLDG